VLEPHGVSMAGAQHPPIGPQVHRQSQRRALLAVSLALATWGHVKLSIFPSFVLASWKSESVVIAPCPTQEAFGSAAASALAVKFALPKHQQLSGPSPASASGHRGANTRLRAQAELSLVTLGAAGVGKSETCNTVVDKNRFRVGAGMKPVTQSTEFESFDFAGTLVKVFDTAGFVDASIATAQKFDSLIEPVANFSDRGVDGLLLALPCGRWGLENNASYQLFKDSFGAAALPHTILIFTKCGQVSADDLVRDLKEVYPQALDDLGAIDLPSTDGKDVVRSYPIVAMGDLSPEGRSADRRRLIEVAKAVSARNDGRAYDSAAFAAVRDRRAKQEERMQALPEEVRDALTSSLERVRKGMVEESALEEKLVEAEALQQITDPEDRRRAERRLVSSLRNELLGNKVGVLVGKLFSGLTSIFR